ncbi:hypothetical protein CDIFMA2_04410 [Clostridioides difficile]|uniref:hypothetical protein n=1 Tax=Clostridioides difficile TaxID=1496 RepID=UPI0021C7CD8E|nr:hypothetical protein [Clostridioides difficile]UUV14798.1 hypothetical protein NQ183_00050 [Clostridioides difficile]UWD42726.1 hypothetical protein NYF05_07070 [Clostridioides difficile]WLD26576.1 hypothetical protein CDIFMA2_04410 [Clostridioides difficile]
MNINKLIIETIESLDIDTFYIEASKGKDKYCVFSIYKENEEDIFDNLHSSIKYYITVNYWFRNPMDAELYKEIKKKMKLNKFKIDGCRDLPKTGDYYGKNIDFIYKQREEITI